MLQHNRPLHGGNIYAALRQQGAKGALLDFSANINPLGLSAQVRQTLQSSLDTVIHYPDAEAHDLKQALSRCYQQPPELITAGNGAVELMYLCCHILKPRRVLVPAPTFSEYENAARSAGAAIDYVYLDPEENFSVNINQVIDSLPGHDIVFICNPNNPTGTLLPVREIERLLKAAAAIGTYVAVDESFMDFLIDDQPYTCRPLLKSYSNLIIFHSLTKFYAIPGLRLGFSLAAAPLTARLHAAKDPWNVNVLAQLAGTAALEDYHYQHTSKAYMAAASNDLYHQLAQIPGLAPYKPSVNFILVRLTANGLTAASLSQAMNAHNILIRDCSNYPGLSPAYIRLAVKQQEQNQLLLTALQKVIGE